MKQYVIERVKETANYVVLTECTVREAARRMHTSKSTVYNDLVKNLPRVSPILYAKVYAILQYNKSVRHIRGGEETRKRWANLRRGEQIVNVQNTKGVR